MCTGSFLLVTDDIGRGKLPPPFQKTGTTETADPSYAQIGWGHSGVHFLFGSERLTSGRKKVENEQMDANSETSEIDGETEFVVH